MDPLFSKIFFFSGLIMVYCLLCLQVGIKLSCYGSYGSQLSVEKTERTHMNLYELFLARNQRNNVTVQNKLHGLACNSETGGDKYFKSSNSYVFRS
jgi:hypothetical protein